MYSVTFIFIVFVANNGIHTHKLCTDTKTHLEKTITTTLNNVITGKGSKANAFDPLPLASLIGNFSNLQYNAYNSTMTGLKNCKITKLKISPDGKSAEIVLDCPNFDLVGEQNFDGYFLYLPSKGFGGYIIHYGHHIITVFAQLKHIGCGSDLTVQFGEFSLQPKSKGKTVYKFSHVFNGNEDVTSKRNAFANEHCDEMVFFSQGPVLYPVVQNLLLLSNKELAKMCT